MGKKAIALDIGGTNTRCALIDQDYHVLNVVINPTLGGDPERFLSQVKKTIRDTVKDFSDVEAIAGGVPGRVAVDGYIEALPNIGVDHIDLAHSLSEEFSLPCFIANDAEVAGLAEANVGPYSCYPSLFFVTISTGVGGALIINGKIRRSSYEIGHTLFSYRGQVHEFEHLASGHYLTRMAKQCGVEVKDAKDFFALAKKKDERILPIYQDWIKLFSQFFAMIQDTFQPDVFTLTGGAMKSADVFWDDMKAACPNCNLQKCHFGQEAGLIGAAVLAFQNAESK